MSIKTHTTVGFSRDGFASIIAMQSERASGIIGNVKFLPSTETADWLVCYGDLPHRWQTHVPWARRILVTTEPPDILDLKVGFCRQFSVIIGPVPVKSPHSLQVRTHGGLTWFYPIRAITAGASELKYDFEALAQAVRPPKRPDISVVLSRKTQTRMHVQRLAFVEALKQQIGEHLHIYGSGFERIDCKADAIDPYDFHLALENNDIDHFWTEKIADSYLGFAFPIYSGCRNITDYFPANSLLQLDINNTAEAVAKVADLIASPLSTERKEAIAQARHRLMHQHSLLALLAGVVDQLHAERRSVATRQETLFPNKHFRTLAGHIRSLAFGHRSERPK